MNNYSGNETVNAGTGKEITIRPDPLELPEARKRLSNQNETHVDSSFDAAKPAQKNCTRDADE